MNIAYACDNNYIPQTGISMISLFENNKDADSISVYLIAKDVSEDNVKLLKGITENYHRDFIVVNFGDIAYDLNLSAIGRHIETIYAKVFFPRIEGVDKMIYFDSDTVVVGSLKELWEEDLDGYYLGAVATNPTKFFRELGLPKGDRFFNDGMAICNVDYCRKNDFIGKVLQVVDEFDGNPPTLSEGALNKVCYGKVKYISLRYNLMAGLLDLCSLDLKYMAKSLQYSEEDLRYSCEHPTVIHYLTAFYNRPWLSPCTHPYKDEFFRYKAMSPWSDKEIEYKPLPFKLRMIRLCYSILGLKITGKLRKLLMKS